MVDWLNSCFVTVLTIRLDLVDGTLNVSRFLGVWKILWYTTLSRKFPSDDNCWLFKRLHTDNWRASKIDQFTDTFVNFNFYWNHSSSLVTWCSQSKPWTFRNQTVPYRPRHNDFESANEINRNGSRTIHKPRFSYPKVNYLFTDQLICQSDPTY